MLKTHVTEVKPKGPALAIDERALAACSEAARLEKAGDYEGAYHALREFWPNRDEAPHFSGLSERSAAEVLLRAGAVSGRYDSTAVEANQDTAKDILTKAWERFELLGDATKAAEARGQLGLCYWREGSYDEARIHLRQALDILADADSELRATLLIRAAVVEVDAQRFDEAVGLYSLARTLVDKSQDEALKGSFHIGYGLLLRRLAHPKDRDAYMDRALIEYAAASYHFERAGNDRYLARVENNLGYLYFTIGQYQDAHAHLDRARYIFVRLRDLATAAQVDETRARTLLAQGHPAEAERIVRAAVRVLERAGQQAVLSQALTIHGVALARLGNDVRARALFDRAIEIATTAGDLEGAALVKLALIEEMGEKISAKDLMSVYQSALGRLKESQDPTSIARLLSCAEKVFQSLERLDRVQREYTQEWEGFTLKKHVTNAESKVIERALREAEGSVTKAAKLLGFRHHQSLISLLNTRHKDLIGKRSAARKRRRHIVNPAEGQRRRSKPKTLTEA
jgi:tetratricopeptide (TPR) repeat protein